VSDGKGKKYSILKTDGVMIFRTPHFTAERESVLHSGIYSKELASSIAAGGLVVFLLLLWSFFSRRGGSGGVSLYGFWGVALMLGLFVLLSVLFRVYFFKGRNLELVLDKKAGKVEIFFQGLFRNKRDEIPMWEIDNVLIESKKKEVENPEGVEFVEKISLQHGMSIPGFGEEKTFYQIKLKIADGSERTIFADTDMKEALAAHEEIAEFLGLGKSVSGSGKEE
jgi:hypothetical protein